MATRLKLIEWDTREKLVLQDTEKLIDMIETKEVEGSCKVVTCVIEEWYKEEKKKK